MAMRRLLRAELLAPDVRAFFVGRGRADELGKNTAPSTGSSTGMLLSLVWCRKSQKATVLSLPALASTHSSSDRLRLLTLPACACLSSPQSVDPTKGCRPKQRKLSKACSTSRTTEWIRQAADLVSSTDAMLMHPDAP